MLMVHDVCGAKPSASTPYAFDLAAEGWAQVTRLDLMVGAEPQWPMHSGGATGSVIGRSEGYTECCCRYKKVESKERDAWSQKCRQAKPSQAKPSQAKRPAASLTHRVHRAADSISAPSPVWPSRWPLTQSLSCTRRCGAVACRRIQTNILRTSLRQKQQEEKRDMDANKWRLLEEFQAPRSLRRMHACTRALFFRPTFSTFRHGSCSASVVTSAALRSHAGTAVMRALAASACDFTSATVFTVCDAK